MAFARKEELTAKVCIVLALSIEAGIILEGARKHICAISDIGPLFEGTGGHRQRDAIAAPDRSSAIVSRASVDVAAAWAVLEQLVDQRRRHIRGAFLQVPGRQRGNEVHAQQPGETRGLHAGAQR